MAKVFYDTDVTPGLLRGRKVAVLGYGSQGHAHALNLRDAGYNVVVGVRPGSLGWESAVRDGLDVASVAEAVRAAQVVMVLLPDTVHREVYERDVRPGLTAGKLLLFAHGFSVHYGQVVPPPGVDVGLLAPKSPGHVMRRLYTEGVGVPALLAVHQDATGQAEALTLAYAQGVGCTRAGVLKTTFAEETETDLFGEQAVLCGGLTSLIQAGFDTLVEAGYQPELAYFECCHEVKLIVDLIYQGGLAAMRHSVSDTAEYGDYVSGPRVVNETVRAEMRKVLEEVRNGAFARRWLAENEAGRPEFERLRAEQRDLPLEQVGRRLRTMMPWLQGKVPATGTVALPVQRVAGPVGAGS